MSERVRVCLRVHACACACAFACVRVFECESVNGEGS